MASIPKGDFLDLQAQLLGRYLLDRELGRGGMGVVILAREIKLDRLVALKFLPPLLASQPLMRERFLREARIAASLSHPNIVPIYAVDELDDSVFYAMAFVDGETLEERVRRLGRVSAPEASKILREIAWALAYAHHRGIVHRDIKPDNVMLDHETGRAQVTDFGIAHIGTLARVTAQGELVGTPAYMSPEQASGEEPDARSDIYSLGVLAYFILSGQPPFDGPSPGAILAKHLTQAAAPLREAAPNIPDGLIKAVERCLAKDPGIRFQTAEEFAEAIGSALPRKRELPKALRQWVNTRGEIALTDAVTAPLLGIPVYSAVWGSVWSLLYSHFWFATAASSFSGFMQSDAAGKIAMFVASPLMWLVRRALLLRRVYRAGYDLQDLRGALAMVGEPGSVGTNKDDVYHSGWGVLAPLLGVLPLAVLLFVFRERIFGTLRYTWRYFFPAPVPAVALGLAVATAALLAIGSLAEFTYGLLHRGQSLRLRVRRWVWGGMLGRVSAFLGRLISRGSSRPRDSSHQATELALGSAARAAYEALAKNDQRALRDLPRALDRLEADASRARAEVAELDELLAATSRSPTRVSLASDPDLSSRHAAVRSEITARRESAERRLQAIVSALEILRLDLLRLRIGGVSIPAITADIAAALEVSRRVEARDEVTEVVVGEQVGPR